MFVVFKTSTMAPVQPQSWVLRTIYELFMRTSWRFISNSVWTIETNSPPVQPEAAMVAITGMTVLCTVGVAFYVRFLVALCKECRHRRIWTCYFARIRPGSGECV